MFNLHFISSSCCVPAAVDPSVMTVLQVMGGGGGGVIGEGFIHKVVWKFQPNDLKEG